MKILVLGGFGNGALENFYVEGLRRLGQEVSCFDITSYYYEKVGAGWYNKVLNKINPFVFFRAINSSLIEFVDNKHFDVVIVFKGMTLFPETIQEVKRHAKLTCNYNPDHPFVFFTGASGNSNITESLELFDLHFSYSKSIVSAFKKNSGVPARLLPFGFDDMSQDLDAPHENSNSDLIFAGAFDTERHLFIEKVKAKSLKIYGDHRWAARTSKASNSHSFYQGRSLFGLDYIKVLRESLGVLNMLRRQNMIEGSHNMRSFEVPGYGGLLMANRTEEHEEYFVDGEEAIFFDSIEELNEKIAYLEAHPQEVSRIKRNAFSRAVASGYGYSFRSAQLLNYLKEFC